MLTNFSAFFEQMAEQAGFVSPSLDGILGGSSPLVLGLLALPFFGMFVSPAVRLGGAITNSASAILSALVVCLSSWCTLIIQYVTALTFALRPRAEYIRVLRFIIVGAALMYLLSWVGKGLIPYAWWLGVFVAVAGLGAYVRMIVFRGHFGRKSGYSGQTRPLSTAWWLTGAVAVAVATFALALGFEGDISECLEGRKLDGKCLTDLDAEAF